MEIFKRSSQYEPEKDKSIPNISIDYSRFEKMTDHQVWDSFKNGSDDALCFIYRVHASILFQFGCQLTSDKETVKDCIQDLFIYLKKKRKYLGKVISIKSYLYKSIHRLIQKKNVKARKLFFQNDFNKSDFSVSIPMETKLIEGEALSEKIKYVEKELNQLTSKQKQAITHYFYDGFTHEEIACIMGLSSNDAARMLINRGLDTIKEKISKYKFFLLPIGLLFLVSLLQIFF
ncbi:MAG: sigma-70 family RNA polymerase sigma factor [Bacteroidota bacterium]